MKPIPTSTAESIVNAYEVARDNDSSGVEIVHDTMRFKMDSFMENGRRCVMFSMSDDCRYPPCDSMAVKWVNDVHTVSRNPADEYGRSVTDLMIRAGALVMRFEIRDEKEEKKVGFPSGYPPRL